MSFRVSETAAGISVRWLRKVARVGFGNYIINCHSVWKSSYYDGLLLLFLVSFLSVLAA